MISPAPPPMPNVAEMRPMLEATRSRGNSSRMIAKHSGKMPPPAPCSTRPATTSSSVSPSAATTEPAANTVSEITSSRRLPNMSPRRPKMGVQTAAESRYAVSVHATPLASVWSWTASSPRAGISVVCARANASAATLRMSRLRMGCGLARGPGSRWEEPSWGSGEKTDRGVRIVAAPPAPRRPIIPPAGPHGAARHPPGPPARRRPIIPAGYRRGDARVRLRQLRRRPPRGPRGDRRGQRRPRAAPTAPTRSRRASRPACASSFGARRAHLPRAQRHRRQRRRPARDGAAVAGRGVRRDRAPQRRRGRRAGGGGRYQAAARPDARRQAHPGDRGAPGSSGSATSTPSSPASCP